MHVNIKMISRILCLFEFFFFFFFTQYVSQFFCFFYISVSTRTFLWTMIKIVNGANRKNTRRWVNNSNKHTNKNCLAKFKLILLWLLLLLFKSKNVFILFRYSSSWSPVYSPSSHIIIFRYIYYALFKIQN